MTTQNIMELRDKIMPVIQKRKLQKVVLFGSRARGDNTPESDYDFYIDAPEMTSLFELSGLYTDFEDILEKKVDIVLTPDEYTQMKKYIADAIYRDGVKIYG